MSRNILHNYFELFILIAGFIRLFLYKLKIPADIVFCLTGFLKKNIRLLYFFDLVKQKDFDEIYFEVLAAGESLIFNFI